MGECLSLQPNNCLRRRPIVPVGRDGRITFMDLAGRRNGYNVAETDIRDLILGR